MFYIEVTLTEGRELTYYTTGGREPMLFTSLTDAEAFIITSDHIRSVPPERATYRAVEGDPRLLTWPRPAPAAPAAPAAPFAVDPSLPMELEDGTPVELVELREDLGCVRIRPLREPVAGWVHRWPGQGVWAHRLADGVWGGSRPGEYLRLRNVDRTVPAWKLSAHFEVERVLPAEQRVPWRGAPWHTGEPAENHFARLVVEEGAPMVGFYQSERHGEAGRLTKMRPGRYLTRYFGEVLTNEQVEALTADVTVQAKSMDVQWTQDADEIETIYVNGPRSCMSHRASNFAGPCHPARVYAGPDLAVAWLGEQDNASARAIVWPEEKLYGGVYGDVSRMTRLLEAKGFRRGDFDGARIQRIQYGEGFVMPYVDVACGAYDDGDCLVLGGGNIETNTTDGLSDVARTYCEHCHSHVHEDDTNHVLVSANSWASETWCDCCTSDYASYCDHRGEYVSDEGIGVTEVLGLRGYSFISDDRLSDAGFRYVESRNEYWHDDHVFACEDCGEAFHVDDRDDRDVDADLCEGCADKRAENRDCGEAGDDGEQLPLPLPEPAGAPAAFAVERDGASYPATMGRVDLTDPGVPFEIFFNGTARWFYRDGTSLVDRYVARNIPAEYHAMLPAETPLALAA